MRWSTRADDSKNEKKASEGRVKTETAKTEMVEEREEREDMETRCGKKENEEKNRGKSSEVATGVELNLEVREDTL